MSMGILRGIKGFATAGSDTLRKQRELLLQKELMDYQHQQAIDMFNMEAEQWQAEHDLNIKQFDLQNKQFENAEKIANRNYTLNIMDKLFDTVSKYGSGALESLPVATLLEDTDIDPSKVDWALIDVEAKKRKLEELKAPGMAEIGVEQAEIEAGLKPSPEYRQKVWDAELESIEAETLRDVAGASGTGRSATAGLTPYQGVQMLERMDKKERGRVDEVVNMTRSVRDGAQKPKTEGTELSDYYSAGKVRSDLLARGVLKKSDPEYTTLMSIEEDEAMQLPKILNMLSNRVAVWQSEDGSSRVFQQGLPKAFKKYFDPDQWNDTAGFKKPPSFDANEIIVKRPQITKPSPKVDPEASAEALNFGINVPSENNLPPGVVRRKGKKK